MNNITTFGNTIRDIRTHMRLPIRKVAAHLDIDPSTLSKIERNERSANKNMVGKLAELFKIDYNELLIAYLSDKVASDLVEKDLSDKVLLAAKNKLKHYKAKEAK
jgi:transcriptional regulator with XRE-family HTH domain